MAQVIPKVIPSKILKLSCLTKKNGSISFHFKLPKDGLALRSVRITNGLPEFTFVASRNVPTIQEEDIATAFRLAQEDKRPEFFYLEYPPNHPLSGRWHKQYSPDWLRWTGIGKVLARADWNMKCLNIGARSNEEKTKLSSWSFTSKLTGLATTMDFPNDEECNNCSVILSCDSARVQKNDEEFLFTEDPKMIITYGSRKLYSKYISEILPSIAYHDEPNFLKVQEVIKLVLAVEWLCNEKGIEVNREWMMKHTTKPSLSRKANKQIEHGARNELPDDMIPEMQTSSQPPTDVSVTTFEAGKNKFLTSLHNTKRFYGYCNYQEFVFFQEDAKPGPSVNLLMISTSHTTSAGNLHIVKSIPVSDQASLLEQLAYIKQKVLKCESYEKGKSAWPAHGLTNIEDSNLTDGKLKIKISRNANHVPPLALPSTTETTEVAAAIDDYDLIFNGMDPKKMPIPSASGLIFPDVETWNELVEELSEHRPLIIQFPCSVMMDPIAGGGVATSSIPVREEPLPRREVRVPQKSASCFSSYSHNSVSVRAENGTIKAQTNSQFEEISKIFLSQWNKQGKKPIVKFIFAINNTNLEAEWKHYMATLTNQTHNLYFHGTSVCELVTTTSGQLCNNLECGICGIAANGANMQLAGKYYPEKQRFGRGFYLAPHSSKSDEYTSPNRCGYRAMLLCDVLLGRQHDIYEGDSEDIKGPSPHFDSIVVHPNRFNLPEVVVFDERAVLPRYIIIYQKDENL